jgi:DNA-directed RNA polymerase subunit M/transcription elongation factor TFIIS
MGGFSMLEVMEDKPGKFGDLVRSSVQAVDDAIKLKETRGKCGKCHETTRLAKPKEVEAKDHKKWVFGYCRACGALVKAPKE